MDKYKLLLVEDDLFLRDLYHETLQSAGYITDTAANGQEAYDKMKQGGYDLVLLDIVLPIMDGIEIMRKLKTETVAAKNKCVVFLTNLDNEADIKAALELGSGYIIKSQITPADLLNEVKVYLEKTKDDGNMPPSSTPPTTTAV